MEIWTSVNPSTWQPKLGPCALTIGNFDGAHRGHQELFRQVLQTGRNRGLKVVATTFDPHPETFFSGNEGVWLFAGDQKQRAMAEVGFSAFLCQHFSQEFANQDAETFCHQFLGAALDAQIIVVGANFCFGRNRKGCAKTLQDFGRDSGRQVIVVSDVECDGEPVSSTAIRRAVKSGDVCGATNMLGRPYALEGWLRPGDKIGRTIGVPTMNLHESKQLVPADGVYAGYIWLSGYSASAQPQLLERSTDAFPAVINVGLRPTVSGKERRIEAHILSGNWPKEVYNKAAAFYFCERIRGEKKFADLQDLKTQIDMDITAARRLIKV